MLKLVSRWGPAVLMMLFLFFMSSQAKGSTLMPDFGGWHDLVVKKGAHILCYGVLALAFLRGLGGDRPPQRMTFFFALLLTALYAITDEYHQTFVPGREGRWQDVLIDTTGASLTLAALYLRRRGIVPVNFASLARRTRVVSYDQDHGH